MRNCAIIHPLHLELETAALNEYTFDAGRVHEPKNSKQAPSTSAGLKGPFAVSAAQSGCSMVKEIPS
jgi:hypothetical protein